MRKYYFLWLWIVLPFLGLGQPFGNEWINYGQKYYKIKVAKDGIYRIDSLTLAKAGVPLNSINPKNLQLFFHGKQQYIYIQGEADGVFNKNDYLEFYGQHNDGSLDSVLFPAGLGSSNPYYSLFNDTSTYYLTWNSSLSNYRMSVKTDTSFSTHTAAPYFIAKTVSYGSTEYYGGRRYQMGGGLTASDPRYTGAEGWFFPEIDLNQTTTYSLNIPKSLIYNSGPAAIVKTAFAGESDAGFTPDHHIQITSSWGGASPITDTIFCDTFPVIRTQYNVAASLFATNNPSLTFYSANSKLSSNINTTGNITAVSYITTQYPHTPNMNGIYSSMLYVPDDTLGPTETYLNLNNFSVNVGDTTRLYDLTNHNRIVVVQSGGICKTLVPNGSKLKQCYLASDDSVYKVLNLIPAGVNGDFTQYAPIGRGGLPYIIITHPSLMSEASVYASYRSGTGYNVVLTNVEELYDQYGYGVEKDPVSIRNFCNYALHKWRTPPQYLLLIGKGIHAPLYRPDTAKYSYASALVPSMGYPSSDVLLTSGLTGNFLKPAIPTGRIAAANTLEISNYLSKVEYYESKSNMPALWQKNVVHFGGGADALEQAYILSLLGNYASIIEAPYFGANVYLFQKTTSAPIQLTLADSVTNLINNGVSIMTFFGHASGDNFDVNLDAPSDYNNVNKYPLIIADACFSGDIFQPVGYAVSSVSEQFVLDPKGSIGFIATDDIGSESYLYYYTKRLYQDIAKNMYRKSLGLCMQNTVNTVQSNDPTMIMTCLEMTLHADPAIAINWADSLPDYAVTDSSVYFTPGNVTTQLNTFKVSVVVSNLAEAINQPVQMVLTRTFPNGVVVNYDTTFKNIYYRDTITFTLPVDKIKGPGLNRFTVSVDPSNLLKEITKTNNQLITPAQLWITSGDIVPVYPYNFAIIPNDTATLKASTGDPNAPLRKYLFQVDTSGQFNSPWLKSQVVSSLGGVVCAAPGFWVNTPGVGITKSGSGNPFANTSGNRMLHLPVHGKGDRAFGGALTFTDSTVYYWRVMRDTSDTKDFPWEESSFQYIKGKTGWGQANYYQFVNNDYNYINTDIPHRKWDFSTTGKTLECYTFGMPVSNLNATNLYATLYKLDLTIQAYAGCQPYPGIYVAVIDQASATPWNNLTDFKDKYGEINYPGNGWGCHSGVNYIYWETDPAQMAGLNNLLNAVPAGDYILAYSWIQGGFQEWQDSTALRATFRALGASPNFGSKTLYPDTIPWIFFAQKGTPSSAIELKGNQSNDSMVHLTTVLPYKEDFGGMTTPLIGPAVKWDSLAWRQHSLVTKNKDSVRINVIGVDVNGNPKTLIAGITPAVASMYITSINAKLYPYLQLSMYCKDTLTHTPSQMNKWQVFFTPVPEVAVNPSIYSYFHKDSLNVGDTVNYKTVVQNISPYLMDSMLYNTWIVDAGNAIHYLPGKMTKKLKPGDTTMLSLKLPTTGYPGNNSVWIEVNPLSLPITRLEEYHFNNYTKESFYVVNDKINPLMDVTFDGIHILNNDIVSPHPNILIEVMDENKFLALNDPSDYAVYLRNLDSTVSRRIDFGPQMIFTPAVLPNNKCKILYTPTLADGTYQLSVQAKDRAGNLSGTNNYSINFQVVNKSMISNVLNYPNPFSTATRFVFTLTGDQVPTYFKIQIMTITGKVVREITESEIGPIHIGRNITDYAWDGTDQYGDKLANGVYLYRVVTSINGQGIDLYATDADQYFKKGWGKMYLIR
jgi:hypothetical protein